MEHRPHKQHRCDAMAQECLDGTPIWYGTDGVWYLDLADIGDWRAVPIRFCPFCGVEMKEGENAS